MASMFLHLPKRQSMHQAMHQPMHQPMPLSRGTGCLSSSAGRVSWYFLPLLAFLVLASFLLSGLFSDPRQHESALLQRQLPDFQLPLLPKQPSDAVQQITRQDLLGKPFLLNIWGLWCATCDAELAFMTTLRQQGVPIVGLYYVQPIDPSFDAPFNLATLSKDVATRLAQRGDPYLLNMVDEHRSLIFDLGVSGAPETFLIDANGVIVDHLIGDLNENNWPALAAKWQALQRNSVGAGHDSGKP